MIPIGELRKAAKAAGWKIRGAPISQNWRDVGEGWQVLYGLGRDWGTDYDWCVTPNLGGEMDVLGRGPTKAAATARARKNALIVLRAIAECKLTDEEE